ncbi:MAG: hypothetical protein B6U86_04555 [Candidatus Altiarchaeales archaeon ex4484_43]|nr:MAG: hypothetical protein B6U86_04555 [Candidatus Altiarchaeales archaeon ex4484_43]
MKKKIEIILILVTITGMVGSYLSFGVLGWAALVLIVFIPLDILRTLIFAVFRGWESSLKKEDDKRYMLIIFALWAIPAFLVLCNIDFFLTERFENPLALKALGFILSLVGMSMLLYSIYSFGFLRTARIPEVFPVKYERKLIKEGIYSIIRHPLYLSELCIIMGNFLISGVLSLLLLFLIWIFILPRLLRWEEERLIQRFGEEYIEYKREVGGIIPKF